MSSRQINVLADDSDQELLARLQALTNLNTTNLTKLSWKLLEYVLNRQAKPTRIKTYVGIREAGNQNRVRVLVEEGDREPVELPPSPLKNYRDTPFSWGEYSKGADALAQAILAHEFGPEVAEIYGGRFKDQVIVHLSRSKAADSPGATSNGSGNDDEEWRFALVFPF